MVSFDIFWPRLKAELSAQPELQSGVRVLNVPKWSQRRGELGGTFALLYKGGDTLLCETATTDGMRQVSAAEIRKVYEVWRDYRNGRRGRAYIVHQLGVQNSTWIIPLLRRFESLMF
jgi:hypothetical protein